MTNSMCVRHARPGDVPALVAISAQVQAKLTASGSQQEFGPLPVALVAAHVAAQTAYALESGAGRILGGVLVPPATGASYPALRCWGLADLPGATFFLEKLMIAPEEQGHGLGATLLQGVRSRLLVAPHDTIVLDCWVGNDPLRAFYARAGFHLYGAFPAGTPLGAFTVAVFTSRPIRQPGERGAGE